MENTQPIPTPISLCKPIIRRYQELKFNKFEKFKKVNKKNHTTTIKYSIQLSNPSALYSLVSNLKDLSHITSLSLDLSSARPCTPKHLKSLSIILKKFKKLTSLSITFPTWVEITPYHIICLGFALHRLRALTNLSFKFNPELRLEFPSLKPFAKLLLKLTRLRSLALSHFASTASFAMTFLPPVLRKLAFLENLNLNFAGMGSFQSKFLNRVFLALKKKNKKPFKNLAFNFKDCAIDFPNSDPICQGLAMFDLSQLQTFKLHFPPNPPHKILEKLNEILQASPLKQLTLDFSKEKASPWTPPQFSLNLQSFKCLSHLSLNPDNLKNGILGVRTAIKTLINLESLSINFSEQIHYRDKNRLVNNIDLELIEFLAGLNCLKKLKSLSLNLNILENMTGEGLRAVSASLQFLTGLTSLNLGLAKMKRDPWDQKRMTCLWQTLVKLTKLTDLSLDFSEHEYFEQVDLIILANTIESLSSLRSVNLNFKSCELLGQDNGGFSSLFMSLGELKFLNKISLEIPCIEENMDFEGYEIFIEHVENKNIHRNVVRKNDNSIF